MLHLKFSFRIAYRVLKFRLCRNLQKRIFGCKTALFTCCEWNWPQCFPISRIVVHLFLAHLKTRFYFEPVRADCYAALQFQSTGSVLSVSRLLSFSFCISSSIRFCSFDFAMACCSFCSFATKASTERCSFSCCVFRRSRKL